MFTVAIKCALCVFNFHVPINWDCAYCTGKMSGPPCNPAVSCVIASPRLVISESPRQIGWLYAKWRNFRVLWTELITHAPNIWIRIIHKGSNHRFMQGVYFCVLQPNNASYLRVICESVIIDVIYMQFWFYFLVLRLLCRLPGFS